MSDFEGGADAHLYTDKEKEIALKCVECLTWTDPVGKQTVFFAILKMLRAYREENQATIESLRAEIGGLKDLMNSLIEDIEDGTFDKNDNRQQYVLLLKDKVK